MNEHRLRCRHPHQRKRKHSPYINFKDILSFVMCVLGALGIAMFLLTSIFILLTAAFIILKVLALVTFSWGWVFAPIWLPLATVLGFGVGAFIGGYLFNGAIFVKRLCTGKIGK